MRAGRECSAESPDLADRSANSSFMNLSSIEYFYLFTVAFLTVSALTPLMRLIAIKYGVVDTPNASHKTHKRPVPYLGGVAIVLGILIVAYGAIFYRDYTSENFWLATTVLAPAVLMSVIGLLDDIKNLSPWPRFLAQNLVGIASAAILISTNTVGSPTGSIILDVIITIVWIVGLTNSINFLDNIDGGASGVVAISSFFLFLIAYEGGQILISSFALALTGATLGFLIWNRPPARIYMGDAGSLFLGLLIATLTVRLEPNPINQYARFAIPLLIMAVPILDTSVAVISRVSHGISPFQGGRDHLSHRLMKLGFSKRQSVTTIWGLSIFFGALAWLISNANFSTEGTLTLIGAGIWISTLIFFLRSEPLPS